MKEVAIKIDNIVLEISEDELLMIGNALNEICNGIEVRNFEKKIGISRSQAEGILRSINELYQESERVKWNERNCN